MAQEPDEFITGSKFMGEVADTVGFVGIFFDIVALLLKWFEEEGPDPLWVSLNKIHAKLSEIDDNVLATWVTEREENIAFLLSHSTAALQTAHAFVKSGAARSDPEWAPKLALALRDSFVAVTTFTASLEGGFWLRPNSIKAISTVGDPTNFGSGWMTWIPDRAEQLSFNRVWDYRWALPAALYAITARIIVLRVAGDKSEITSQEINRYLDFTAKVLKKMESGIRSVGKLGVDVMPNNTMSSILNAGVPIAVADIYGGYYLGGLSHPGTLVPFEPKAAKIPFPPFVQTFPPTLDAFSDVQNKFQEHWKNIVKERIGIGELFRVFGGLENALKMLTEQSTKLSKLRDKGIDFSVPEDDLLGWLNDPGFTPYPAISQAMLNLLGNKRLRKPVHLDVIVFNYEETAGVTSPRKLEDVDFAVLRKAVLEGYNERHGEGVTDFQSLLI